MPIPLLLMAASGSVLLVGAAIYMIQNTPNGTFRPGTRTPLQPATPLPQEFEGNLGYSDTIDPLHTELEGAPSSINSSIADLQNSMAAEATEVCRDCPACGFLAGYRVNASFPFLPAMDYQRRVSTMMVGGQPLLQFWPQMPRIEEWSLGGRSRFDGFNQLLCFLIEAKMGYGRYLGNNSVYLSDPTGGTINTLPILTDATSTARMANVAAQMLRHHTTVLPYPVRNYDWFIHHFFWFGNVTLTRVLALRAASRSNFP